MIALIAFFVISHILSFACSIFESVLLSCTHSYISLLKKKGEKAGALLEELKSRVDRPLAAILTVNTISHTIGAAGVGATVVSLYGEKWFALGSVILTLTMLYWTEMLPKTVGALYWKPLAPFCARSIKVLMVITYPFVLSFNLFGRLLARGKRYDRITEEDIRLALEAGAKAGVIEEAEQDMVENIFRLGDRRVGVLMQPRVDIEWLNVKDPLEEIRTKILSSEHHRFPVCEGDVDQVVGIVHSRQLLARALLKKSIDLRAMIIPPLFVHENLHVFELMDLFKKTQNTMALVTDEYGTIQGMITIGDIFNAIIKDIDQQTGQAAQIIRVNNRSWLLDGKIPIDEFKEIFHIEELPDEDKARYRTLSGLCMTRLEAVPKKGDTFVIDSMRFEVLKVRKRRVEKILFTRQSNYN
ncbi:MAG: Magnesium and cobalt efflux protein CorC [Chlamydiae bacterium]|nr:Magnesium and cobalt efflux protein CorC [Chlamydiota bacterium]